MPMSDTETGKFISYVLRHNPGAIGLSMDGHGKVSVQELLEKMPERFGLDFQGLCRIVEGDPQSRYSMDEGRTLIWANQGHSIGVDVEMVVADPPQVLYHGTGEKYLAPILAEGILPKSRLYVHLSGDAGAAESVGSRHGRPVVLEVDAAAMRADGHTFRLSANGVWLVGSVPAKYVRIHSQGD